MSAEQNVPEGQSHGAPPPSLDQGNNHSNGNVARQVPSEGDHSFNDGSFDGQPIAHGMGQSKSSRRRRRKRKNKGGDLVGGSAETHQAGAEPASFPPPPSGSVPAISASAAQGGNQANGFHNGGGQAPSQGNGAGPKRWKKKFRDRDRDRSRREENPGNSNAAGSSNSGPAPIRHPRENSGSGDSHQFGNRVEGWKSRKGGGGGKQGRDRGPRSFVGPMDHSYRVVNGNFADTPPATIEQRSNGSRPRSYHSSNDSQPIDYSQGRIVPIPEGAPTKIFFFIDDLFFVAKIGETARKLGVKVAFIKNEKEELARLTGGEEENRPGLIVFDLNNANAKPLTLIPKLKAKLKRSTSIIGFLSHIQGDLKAKAVEAGCDTVMPRAAFSQNLPNLLRRYGLEEEREEANYNQ